MCVSLQLIQPPDVAVAVAAVASLPRGLVADPGQDRAILTEQLRLAPPHPDRSRTMGRFLRLITQRASPVVVETGCQRAHEDYGAGMSTTLFGRVLRAYRGTLQSVDIDPANVLFARRAARGLPVTVTEADSIGFLARLPRGGATHLYLDSLDADQPGSAEHALLEAQHGSAALDVGGAILLDDTFAQGEQAWAGKGRLAVPWLCENGWRIEMAGYQVLLVRV
jgi:hypothetical protein